MMKKTMKQYSFASQLKSLTVVFGIALTFASCAKEDVAQNPTNTDGDNDKNLTTFVAGDEAKTRTSLDYSSSDFSWEAGDYIYVKDDDGIMRKSTNAPTQKVASFRYRVPGKFGASASYKVYYLGKNSNGSQVTISANQTQTAPNNTEHFGTAGDYGTATATGAVGGSIFSFQLEHQAAYLVFQPYTSNEILQNCYLTKVEVTSDNDIATTYTVRQPNGKLVASTGTGSNKIVLTTKDPKSGSSYYDGFPLDNNTADVTNNGAYMVIKPGTHTLRVRYWVKDVDTHVEGTITKIYPSTAYASNTYYDMTADLNVHDYDGDHYYQWDAKEQYWKGREWWSTGKDQPVLNGSSNSNYAYSNSDPRHYNTSFPGTNISNPAIHSCKDLPNVNELTWYAAYGDPRWDADELWTTMGHLYKGGMWFKKKSVLQGEGYYNSNTAVDGTDWRTAYKFQTWSASQSLPSVADASKYFYLPALGKYSSGQLNGVGGVGYYWSSSADSWVSGSAYHLTFYSGNVRVGSYEYSYDRSYGYRVDGFE